MTAPFDPLDDLLSAAAPERPGLRDRLRHETTRVVRRRRHVRRLAWAGMVAAAALLPVLALGWWFAATPPAVAPPLAHVAPREHPPAPEPEPRPDPPPSPTALEWQAFDGAPAERPALYLAAGDRYVEEQQDYAAALRCYREALEGGDVGQALEITPDDNWLVMAIKMDQRKER